MKIFLQIILLSFIVFVSSSDEEYCKTNNHLLSCEGSEKKFQVFKQWKKMDYKFLSEEHRQRATLSRHFIPERVTPYDVTIMGDRAFVTAVRLPGVPSTLNYIDLTSTEESPPLIPYPNWQEQGTILLSRDCNKFINVLRTNGDECNRLWVVDSGMEIINGETETGHQICPPKVVVYDLNTDKEIFRYTIPSHQFTDGSFIGPITVDIRNKQCDAAFAYITDPWQKTLTVLDMANRKSWATKHSSYYPHPLMCNYDFGDGVKISMMAGVLSGVLMQNNELYVYHAKSSPYEFAIKTEALRNESLWLTGSTHVNDYIKILGDRGVTGQTMMSTISKDGIFFSSLIAHYGIYCWNTEDPYKLENLQVLECNEEEFNYMGSMKVDDKSENLYLFSNNLFKAVMWRDYSKYKFRLLRANIKDITKGTKCSI